MDTFNNLEATKVEVTYVFFNCFFILKLRTVLKYHVTPDEVRNTPKKVNIPH